MKHSPAPWFVAGPSGNPGEAHVIENGTRTIAWTANSLGLDGEYTSEEDIANGLVLAAAPEMVVALQRLLLFPERPESRRAAREVLAKARGEQCAIE